MSHRRMIRAIREARGLVDDEEEAGPVSSPSTELDELRALIAALSERVAVLERRGSVPMVAAARGEREAYATSESVAAGEAPWFALGVSKATYYRRLKAQAVA